jgi:accessory colonization factor AcfC
MNSRFAAYVMALALCASPALAAEAVRTYGPGGPAPAMKEAAAAFEKARDVKIEVTAGPTTQWLSKAKQDADIVFSGSENMMTGFIKAMEGQIDETTVEPLFQRPSTILVRKGNPKSIKAIRDLAKPGMKILVVEGAGQVGLWEDVAGRTGDLGLLSAFRRNIAAVAGNSGEAVKLWAAKPELDGWLIWNHWQIANSDIADQVEVEPDLRIWRASDLALTRRGTANPAARAFIEFLRGPEGTAIFAKWGWSR